jgi:hypothetical protein
MARKFVKLEVDRVDVVDRGANHDYETNDGSHILLWKRAMPEQTEAASLMKKLATLLGIAKDDSTPTFSEALMARRTHVIMEEIYDRIGALHEVLAMTLESGGGKAEMTKAVKDFAASVTAAVDGWFADESAKKSAEERSPERAARLKRAADALTSIITPAIAKRDGDGKESNMPASTEMDVEKQLEDKIAKAVADALAKAAKDSDDKVKAAEDKAKAETEALRKQLDSQTDEIKKARETAEAEREQRLLTEQTAVCKTFKRLPVDVAKDAALFVRRSKQAITPEDTARVMELLRAADAQLADSALFKAQHVDHTPTPDSAEAAIMAKAQEMVTKGEAKTVQQAIVKVAETDKPLYDRYYAELEKRRGNR